MNLPLLPHMYLLFLSKFKMFKQVRWYLSAMSATWETETGGWQVPGQPGLDSKALSQNKNI
jgi:hypothetical protein